MIRESCIKPKGFNGINWIAASKKSMPIKIETIKSIFRKGLINSEQLLEYLEKLDPQNSATTGKITAEEAMNKLLGGILKTAIKGSWKDKIILGFMFITYPVSKLADILTGKFKNKKNLKKDLLKSITTGCFDPLSNRIFTSKPGSALHEIGHAINRNTNFFTKIPSKLSLLSKHALIPLAILTAIFTKKPQKLDNEQTTKKNSFKKLKEFVHEHIGLTVAGLSVPLLVEEGLASLRAYKFINASENLNKTAKNQHNKVLAMAFGSYLIGTAFIASIAGLTVFVKDKIVEHTT